MKNNKKQRSFIATLTSKTKYGSDGIQVVSLKDITFVKDGRKFAGSKTIVITKRVKDLIPTDGKEILVAFTAQIVKQKFENCNRSFKRLTHIRDFNQVKG